VLTRPSLVMTPAARHPDVAGFQEAFRAPVGQDAGKTEEPGARQDSSQDSPALLKVGPDFRW
jgi:hypothetical protein